MSLVKAVVSEVEKLAPEGFSDFFGSATDFDGTLNKLRFHLLHHVNFLLTDCLTESISLTTGKTTPFLRNLHELLLVDHNTVSRLEGVLKAWMEVSNWLFPVFAANEGVDKLHWAWAIKRHHSDHILDVISVEFQEIFLHTCRLKLEDTGSICALKQGISLRIVKRHGVHIKIDAIDLTNHTKGVVNHRKVRETEKVHLKKAEFLNLG